MTRALLGEEVFNNASHRTNWVTDWKDIQPRFGFAYQITPKTVLRGGYGIYFGQNRSGANGLLSYGSQGYNQWTQMIASYQNDGATPYLRMNNPFPNGLVQPAKPGTLGPLNDVGYFASGPIRTSSADRTPYEQSWSLGIQQDVGWGTRLDLQYVGKKGTHLYFSGATQLDVLGPQVEKYSQSQMAALNTIYTNPPYCNDPPTNPNPCNPFYGIVTDPTAHWRTQCTRIATGASQSAVHERDNRRAAIGQLHLPRPAACGREALFQWLATFGELHVVEVDRRFLGVR